MKKQIFLIAVAAAGLIRAQAAIPEPDNVIYGLITLGTNLVTAANTNVVISASAQFNGPAIASYQMGWLPSAGNFYTLRIPLESLTPVANPAAALSNQLVYLSVNDGTGVRAQASVTVGGRGQMTRLDLAGANPGQTTIPSDNNPTDNSISINEAVAYLLAWRTGAAWPIAPADIPLSYAVRTGVLWRGGGSYQLNSMISGPPAWWVNTGAPNVVENPTLDSAVASMPQTYLPGQPLTVSTVVTPGSVLSAYGVEDQPPPGWTVVNINNGGAYDAVNGKVKWGLFFDSTPRTLTYQVTPPSNAIGIATFGGQASYDGVVTLNISGQRVTSYAPSPTFGLAAVGLGHSFHIGLKGGQGQTFLIEASTNLTSWQMVSTVVLDATGTDDFYDPISTNQARFYQVILQAP
jgi:hypothetical protein